MTIRDTEEHVVVNHVAGVMAGPMATALHIREFPPFVCDEPSSRGGDDRGPTPLELLLGSLCDGVDWEDGRAAAIADLVGRYCPVDSLMRAAIADYEVTWERL
jgi:hypothetical protein